MAQDRRIFVSHSRRDDDFCLRLIADLRRELGNEAVWYDTSGGLKGGSQWWAEIRKQILERPFFLVVLSSNSRLSNWVQEEMNIAYHEFVTKHKQLLPVRVDNTPCDADWASIEDFDFREPEEYQYKLRELLEVINHGPRIRKVDPLLVGVMLIVLGFLLVAGGVMLPLFAWAGSATDIGTWGSLSCISVIVAIAAYFLLLRRGLRMVLRSMAMRA